MTGFRAEIGLALAAGLFVSAALAQVPAQPVPAELPPAVPAKSAPIEVNTLGTTDGPPAGLLDSAHGGLGSDIWTGSPRSEIEELFARLPLSTPVRSVRALARRLVLTTADAPSGQAPHSFQTIRLKALLNAGLVSDAAKLAALIRLKDDPEFTEVQAEAILLGGSQVEACSDATNLRETRTEPLWMQLRAYCFGISGQGDLLDLTRSVIKAQGADDRAFEILLDDVLAHKSTPPGELHDPTAVDVFLLRQVGQPVGPGLAARFGLAASVLALKDAKNLPAARADAVTQALHAGAASTAELDAIADAQTFTPQQFANAESAAAGLPFFLGQALIRQALAHTNSDDQKAKLLAVAFRQGRQMQLLPVAALMQQDAAASIVPGPVLRSYAPAFSRALLLAHQADAAERWRDMLDPNADADASLAAGLAVTLDLVAPNPGRTARAHAALVWLAQNAATLQPPGGPPEQQIAVLALALYDALGETMPPALQLAPLLAKDWPGRVIAPAVRKRLDEALSRPDRKGEAILTVLATIGAGGPGDFTPAAAATLVRALKAEGEGDAARALAADALLLFQPPSQS